MFGRRFLSFWLPVLLWMSVMFSASTDLGAPKNSSRILRPVLRWLIPDISDNSLDGIQFIVRKCCHAFEYAVLALLLWRAKRNFSSKPGERRGWTLCDARFALCIAAVFAASDEFHQHFVSTRQASIWDVALDTFGAAAGLFLLWLIGRRFKHW